MTRALVLHMDDGTSHVAFVTPGEVDFDTWVDSRYEGLQLLGVIKVVLHDELKKLSRRIDAWR
jgi:hypothetical protein